MVCAFSVFVPLLFDKANEYRITSTINDICVLMILTRPTMIPMNRVVVLKIQTTLKIEGVGSFALSPTRCKQLFASRDTVRCLWRRACW